MGPESQPAGGGGGLVPMGPFWCPMPAGDGLRKPGGIILSNFLRLLDCPLGKAPEFAEAAPGGNGGRLPAIIAL